MARLLHVFFINLKEDKERADKYKWLPYKRWDAFTRDDVPPFIDNKMKSMWNIKRDKHLGRCACFMSHVALLKHIVDNKLNDVLILEDDAIKCDNINHDYQTDGITYLGGLFHQNKMMDQSPVKIWRHGHGISKKTGAFRILMTMAYIVPTYEIAEKMLNYFNELKRYSAIDIMFNELPFPIYYQFPASFIEESSQSTIDPDKKTHSNKYYESVKGG
jgi:GR25 family glycosyltransferase involved in LPS biosynthesis